MCSRTKWLTNRTGAKSPIARSPLTSENISQLQIIAKHNCLAPALCPDSNTPHTAGKVTTSALDRIAQTASLVNTTRLVAPLGDVSRYPATTSPLRPPRRTTTTRAALCYPALAQRPGSITCLVTNARQQTVTHAKRTINGNLCLGLHFSRTAVQK